MSKTTTKVNPAELVERIRGCRPRNAVELGAYVEAFLGLRVPAKRICDGHDSPMDYLAFSMSVDQEHSGDCVVWANRGGGKTQLGAIASLLECVFMPGCAVRILGGSEDQSQRMYEYLKGGLERGFARYLGGKVTTRGCEFENASNVQVLAQSHRSVRGHHVQRLRCDEVELFDPDVWQAAQLITQSNNGIPARLEALSTMHRPFGLMRDIVSGAGPNGMRAFRWCLWEVIERCQGRDCSQCCLWEQCQGRAKHADGYYPIDDAIAQKRRASEFTWSAEMLCQTPQLHDVVFAEFDPTRHVRQIAYDANLPLYRAIDFGFSNPLACLFIQVDADDNVLVLDEHLKSHTTLAEHTRLIEARCPHPVEATYCDPAGRSRHEITGTAATQELAALGIPTRSRPSRILEGVGLIRDFLAPADGLPRLYVSPRCEGLIRAFQSLRYARESGRALSELPEKDGVHDHVIDALRYFFVNRFPRRHGFPEAKQKPDRRRWHGQKGKKRRISAICRIIVDKMPKNRI